MPFTLISKYTFNKCLSPKKAEINRIPERRLFLFTQQQRDSFKKKISLNTIVTQHQTICNK